MKIIKETKRFIYAIKPDGKKVVIIKALIKPKKKSD